MATTAEASSPWRERRFLVFAAGNSLNNIGEAVYVTALPLLAYQLTGSLTTMSLLAALTPAAILLGPVIGVVIDRHGSRAVVLPGLLLQLVAVIWLNIEVTRESAGGGTLLVLGAMIQIGATLYQAGWMAGVPGMFPSHPTRARGTLSSLFIITSVVGPVLVAAALSQIGYVGLLWINAVTFLAPIAVWLGGIRPPAPTPAPPAESGSVSRFVGDLGEGWRILRARRVLFLSTLVGLPMLSVGGVGTVALIIFDLRGRQGVSADHVGIILALFRIGAVVGSLIVSQARHFEVRRWLTITAIGTTAALLLLSVPVLPVVLVGLTAFGAMQGARMAMSAMAMVKYLPGNALGRVHGLLDLIGGIPVVIAPLVIPSIATGIGSGATFLLLGAVGSVGIVALVRCWPDLLGGAADDAKLEHGPVSPAQ
ncbi:MAG: MFS transporter [Streptosporangiaceae bacterium]